MNDVLYGAAYYHEYMPYERLDKGIALMKAADITAAEFLKLEHAKPLAFYDHPFFGQWPAITLKRFWSGLATLFLSLPSDKQSFTYNQKPGSEDMTKYVPDVHE